MENYHPTSSPSSLIVTGDQNSSSSAFPYQPKKRRGSGGKSGAGVKLSTNPQTVAARERRQRISGQLRVLKSLVPGGSKMDTVSVLEKAINYVKFLKTQIWLHQAAMMIPPPHQDLLHSDATNIALQVTGTSAINVASYIYPPDHEEMISYNYATTTALTPSPYCYLQGEEEMLISPLVNYNN